MTRILITNHNTCHNKGNEAILKTVIRETAVHVPDASFDVISWAPTYDAFRLGSLGPSVRVLIPDLPFGIGGRLALTLLGRRAGLLAAWAASRLLQRWRPTTRRTLEAVTRADAVVSVGGDIFSSDYGDLDYQLTFLRVARRCRKPVAILGQTIGPFRTPGETRAFCEVARHVRLMTIRDSANFDYVRDLDLHGVRIELTADPAFLLQPAADHEVHQLMRMYGLEPKARLVAVMPSRGIVQYTGIDEERHRAVLREFLAGLVGRGLRLVLVPHVFDIEGRNDDVMLCAMLAGDLRHLPGVTVLADHSAEEIRGLVARCDLVVSERMHGLVAAASMHVPMIAVSFSAKTTGLMHDLLGDSGARLVFDPGTMTAEQLLQAATWASEKRDELRGMLCSSVGALEERARRNFTILREAIGHDSLTAHR